MKLLIVVLSVTISSYSSAQKLLSNNNLLTYGLMFVSGAASGTGDALVAYRPFRGDHNWDMYISWTNKYKNNDPAQGEKFPLSTSLLVGFTDGWHGVNMIRDVTAAGAAAVSITVSFDDLKDIKNKWKYILGKGAISYAANRVGHVIMYDVILPRK